MKSQINRIIDILLKLKHILNANIINLSSYRLQYNNNFIING